MKLQDNYTPVGLYGSFWLRTSLPKTAQLIGRASGRYAVRPRLRALASAEGQVAKVRAGQLELPGCLARTRSSRCGRGAAIVRLERLPSCRYLPAQGVDAEVQIFQVGEAAQLRRYLPAQVVAAEVQPVSGWPEAAQLRRYLPAQLVCRRGTAMPGWRGCPVPPVSSPLNCRSRRG